MSRITCSPRHVSFLAIVGVIVLASVGSLLARAEAKPEDANLRPRPVIPRHYPHIRIAMLAYAGTPFSEFEDNLLRNSVDLVIPNAMYLERIKKVAPNTPQLIYTNTSNLYLELLLDWLQYADRQGQPRESAFYHASRPVPFRGDSPSSKAVDLFWSVQRGGAKLTDVTRAAQSNSGKIPFGSTGESLYLGYPERFREVNVRLATAPGTGWKAVVEYPNSVNDAGQATGWTALPTLSDAADGLTKSGSMVFDPPANWKPTQLRGGERLYFLRLRATTGGTAPVAASVRGRDYVEAKGKGAGTIPVFDASADANKDGYLDDKEYATRASGKDARFRYESRMWTENYGQMRPATNPSNAAFRDWAVDYHKRYLAKYPLASGLFMDNVGGKPPVKAADVLESLDRYGDDTGRMLAAICAATTPRWVLANTGGSSAGDAVVKYNPAYFEEFGIRPMSHNWSFFEDLAALVARRAALATPAPLAILDSHPQRGNIPDERMQLAVLAYYYLVANPDSTFLVFHGGNEPNTSWKRHWSQAVTFNVGKPTSKWSQWASGADPANTNLSYRIYQREYENALVLFKPLSHVRGNRVPATLGEDTATKHDLNRAYRQLRADGTLGEPVTSITLRNGEGAILVKGKK